MSKQINFKVSQMQEHHQGPEECQVLDLVKQSEAINQLVAPLIEEKVEKLKHQLFVLDNIPP